MEQNGRSRHMTLWRSLQGPQPPQSPRERYGLGDALTGAIHCFGPSSGSEGGPFHFQGEHAAPSDSGHTCAIPK
jgi:hypothetical protein